MEMNTEPARNWARALLTGYLLMAAGQAGAVSRSITAQFAPTLDSPPNYAFTIISASGPICTAQPSACQHLSSMTGGAGNFSISDISANHPDPRQGLTVTVPSDWRDITVYHSTTGETRPVQIRFAGFGGSLILRDNVTATTGIPDVATAHEMLWNGSGLGIAPAPCLGTYSSVRDDRSLQFLWMTPALAACAKQSAFNLRSRVVILPVELVYDLRTPTPLDMASGLWSGVIGFTAGPGQDFDFGDNFTPFAPTLYVTVSLVVSHQLRASFPPGADRLALEPEGGWIAWINGGRRPERIMRDQPFRFTSSGPLQMRLECQYSMAGNCAINNPDGHSVAVETRITLPAGIRESTGGAVSNTLLSDLTALDTASDLYVADQPGLLHFEVGRADVAAMLRYPDTTYSGNVTVLWDSALSP